MAIRYEQCPVVFDLPGGGTTDPVLATTFTAGENRPLAPVRALGFNGAVATVPSGPIEGTFSVTYTLSATSTLPDGCPGSSGPWGVLNGRELLQKPWSKTNGLGCKIAANQLFDLGFATTYSISAEPNTVVSATLAGNFYDPAGMHPGGGTMAAGNVGDGNADALVAHGSTVVVDASLFKFSENAFSASYEASRGVNPIYALGEVSAIICMPTDPQESITLQGDNIPLDVADSVASVTCLEAVQVDFEINDLCGNDMGQDIAVCGFVQSRDIEVAENDILRGNITVVDYNLPQEFA